MTTSPHMLAPPKARTPARTAPDHVLLSPLKIPSAIPGDDGRTPEQVARNFRIDAETVARYRDRARTELDAATPPEDTPKPAPPGVKTPRPSRTAQAPRRPKRIVSVKWNFVFVPPLDGSLSIETLRLAPRTHNALMRADIATLEQLQTIAATDKLAEIEQIGEGGITAIKQAIAQLLNPDKPTPQPSTKQRRPTSNKAVHSTSPGTFRLPVATLEILHRADIYEVEHLTQLAERALLCEIPGLNPEREQEILQALKNHHGPTWSGSRLTTQTSPKSIRLHLAKRAERHATSPTPELTPLELRVLNLLDLPEQHIAQAVGVSIGAVTKAIDQILVHCDAHNRTEAVLRAALWGLIDTAEGINN